MLTSLLSDMTRYTTTYRWSGLELINLNERHDTRAAEQSTLTRREPQHLLIEITQVMISSNDIVNTREPDKHTVAIERVVSICDDDRERRPAS